METELKHTPLHAVHQEYGAKMVPFGGWEMPVQYSRIMQEHHAVRRRAGLFDVSHMGEVLLKGDTAKASVQHLITNDVSQLADHRVMYTAVCYPNGGTVDDLLVYKKSDREWMLVPNAANIENDVRWFQEHVFEGTDVVDRSMETALLALQGPRAQTILQRVTETDVGAMRPFGFQTEVRVGDAVVWVSRTGYTGEDGFEIYADANEAESLWKTIMTAGKDEGLQPCGLGARDTLRLEARLPLYGQELNETITPLEAGIGFAVKTKKEADFIGKQALSEQRESGLKRKIVGIEMVERGIPRTGYEVYLADGTDESIGNVTSGTHSPTLEKNIGLALLAKDATEIGTEVDVQVRKKNIRARVIPTPFYKRKSAQ